MEGSSSGKRRKGRGWSDLPLDVLRLIAKCLTKNADDFRHFQSVCKNWRTSTSISALLPAVLSYSPTDKLFTTTVYLLRPPPLSAAANSTTTTTTTPWMVTAMEATTKGTIHLRHPFSRELLQNAPEKLDLGQYQSCKLIQGFHCSSARSSGDYNKALLLSPVCLPSIEDCFLWALDSKDEDGIEDIEYGYEYDQYEYGDSTWVDLCYGSVKDLDDIENFKGMPCAIDCQGKLYSGEFTSSSLNLCKTLIDSPISISHLGWRKRLVRSSNGESLYLVVREIVETSAGKQLHLKVYKLTEEEDDYEEGKKTWFWVEVNDFEDRVLFVTRDYGFFVAAHEFPTCNLGNCIVFSYKAFPPYRTNVELEELHEQYGSEEGLEDVMVFRLGYQVDALQTISSFPGFPTMLWSPPSWAFNAPTFPFPPCQSQYDHRETEENKEMQFDSNTQDSPSFDEVYDLMFGREAEESREMQCDSNTQDSPSLHEISPPSFGHDLLFRSEAEESREMKFDSNTQDSPSFYDILFGRDLVFGTENEETREMQFDSNTHDSPSFYEVSPLTLGHDGTGQTTENPSTSAPQGKIGTPTMNVGHAVEQACDPYTPTQEIIHSITRAYITSSTQRSRSDTSRVEFEGLDIRSCLVPTLQEIWSKHGNILKNSIMRNGDTLARALESLASAVLILKGNSAWSLNDDQAEYLDSTLSDLQCMSFGVDWLVPLVRKALMLHTSKPLAKTLEDLRETKARIMEMRSKLIDELATLDEMEKELEQNTVAAYNAIPFSGEVDFHGPLVEELP